MQLESLSGQRFGRLVILDRAPTDKKATRWHARCDCGSITIVRAGNLKSRETRSCGCLSKELQPTRHRTHGSSRTPEYNIWSGMIGRCNAEFGDQDYAAYRGRGIQVCERWSSFENFISDMGPRPSPKHSLDRRDNDGNYEPSNCRWAIPVEQSNNRRSSRIVTWNGISQTLAEAVRSEGVSYSRTMNRLRRGWPLEKAILTPPDSSKIPLGLR